MNVDDVEADPDSVEINPQVYVALAELLEGEALDIVQNTTQGAGLEAWRKLVRRFDPQTVGRKRTLLSRIINHGTVKVHELSRAIEQWEERVRSYQSRAREKMSDDVRSGILTEMGPEHIKTHIHLHLTRLPDYASVRSEIETFLEGVRIPMRWTLVVSMDRKVFVAIVDRELIGRQVVPNVARVVARVMMARDTARKASQAKAKTMMAKEKAKVASGKHAKHLMGTASTVGNGDTWERIVSSNPRARVAKAKGQAVSMNLFSWWIRFVLISKPL